MSQVVCFGYNNTSYNNYRMLEALEKHSLEYEYHNIYDVLESSSRVELKNKKILFMDSNVAARKDDFDIAFSAISKQNKSVHGQFFDMIRSSNALFYNKIDSHFKTFNKWSLYNILSAAGIHTPNTKLLGQNTNIESIKKEYTKPLYIKSTSSQDRNNYTKYSFICDNVDYLETFYNEHVLTGSDNLYVVQDYIPHDFFITATVVYEKTYHIITSRDQTVSLPLYSVKPSYKELVVRIKEKLKLNCFSVSFVEYDKKNIVLRVKAPGDLCLIDNILDIDTVGEIVLGFTKHG